MKLIGIKLRGDNRIYKFSADEDIKKGDYVIIKLEKGECIGKVIELFEVPDNFSFPKIERKATKSDIKKDQKNAELEKTAFQFCSERVLAHGLEMKLVRVECLFDRSKLIFYYTADGRVDFRELLKDLVKRFRMRIELRQIGVRNETQMIGGIGPCGRELCCSLFLKSFATVSVKMAKEQHVSLNPEKISGVCGRLMCCLNYEFPIYQAFKKGLPACGEIIKVGDIEGKIIRYSLPRNSMFIETKEGREIEIKLEELKGVCDL
ncbi:MAG: stage 0 sporulation protein [Candidatus Desulfofervidus auxilii]|nr:stage 0 sporulation protein [Candidatus Desulfofervidus auxilii]